MTPNPQDSAVALEVERAAFEANYEKRHGFPLNTRRRDDGRYGDWHSQDLWEAWQARASQADGTSGKGDVEQSASSVVVFLAHAPKFAECESAEPSLRSLIYRYYRAHFEDRSKADDLAFRYLESLIAQGENHVG